MFSPQNKLWHYSRTVNTANADPRKDDFVAARMWSRKPTRTRVMPLSTSTSPKSYRSCVAFLRHSLVLGLPYVACVPHSEAKLRNIKAVEAAIEALRTVQYDAAAWAALDCDRESYYMKEPKLNTKSWQSGKSQ